MLVNVIFQVIGEIGEFDDSHNETIEIQKVVKKRRVIITKTADGEEITTVVEDDQTPVKEGIESQGHEIDRHVERTTIVKTRRVIITKNEFGEDEETVVEDDEPIPIELKVKIIIFIIYCVHLSSLSIDCYEYQSSNL